MGNFCPRIRRLLAAGLARGRATDNQECTTTQIAAARRDQQNVPEDLCLKPRKQLTLSRQDRAEPFRNFWPRIRVLLAPGLARGGATDNQECTTTQIAAARRDQQNVPEDLCLKHRKS